MVTQENMPLSSRFHSTLSKVTSFDAPHFPRALLGSHSICSAHAGSLQALAFVLVIAEAFEDQIRMFP